MNYQSSTLWALSLPPETHTCLLLHWVPSWCTAFTFQFGHSQEQTPPASLDDDTPIQGFPLSPLLTRFLHLLPCSRRAVYLVNVFKTLHSRSLGRQGCRESRPAHRYILLLGCSVVSDYDPVDWSLPGFSVRGIFLARILEWVAIASSRGSS